MRNPAPVVLTLLLAIATIILIARKPEPPAEPAAETPPVEAPVVDPAVEPAEESTETPAAPAEVAETTKPIWPHQKGDIAADPKAVFGQLDNGMRYIILPNAEPPDRVSLRLHIAAGSLMEADDQLGIAHFLEHMVFNGSKNFTPAELIPRMQRLGIAFGAHVNAYTSFDETVYMLDLPDLSEETMKLGFTVMRDFCDGALLLEEEIDNERGVILSEKTSRDSVGLRLMQQQFTELLPDSLLMERFPIGEEEIIKTAPRERFVDFYNRYYTPERMTFVVVGDIDPQAMKDTIANSFGSLTNPDKPGGEPELGKVSSPDALQPAVFSDKEVATTDLGLVIVDEYEPQPDSRELRISRMPLGVAHSILGLRFDRLAKKDGSPIVSGSANRDFLFNFLEIGSIDVTAADDRWQDSVAVLEQEFRRALEFGFTTAEFAEAKANLLNAYEQRVKGRDTRRSEALASAISGSVSGGRVLTTPETDLEIIQAGLEALTKEDCHKAFQDYWSDRGMHLILTTKVEPEDAVETLTKLYAESASQPVEAPEEEVVTDFAYTDFGDPGEVVSREEDGELGIVRLTLSNGVHINLKQTDFEKNGISLTARIGNGRLGMPKDKPGLAEFASAVIAGGGIGEHSADDLQRIFAGKNIGFGFSVGEDAFNLSGRTTPEDLPLQLEAMTAQILQPGYQPEGVTQFRKGVPMLYQQLKHTSTGPMQELSSWLMSDDPRFEFPEDPDTLLAYTLNDARSWLADAFSKAPIELSIAGDFDHETIVPELLRTFGAIEVRTESAPLPDGAREVAFPETPQEKALDYESKIPKGIARVYWQVVGPRGNEEEFRRLQLLGTILSDRLRKEIREKLGASYSPGAGAGGSMAFDNYGYLTTLCEGKPEDLEKLVETCLELASDLAENGATEDELDRARKPALANIDKSLRSNSYWLGTVLAGSQDFARRIELAKSRRPDLEAITLEEINRLAAKYLGPDNAIQVTIESKAPTETDE